MRFRGDRGAVGVREGRKGGEECDRVMPVGRGAVEAGMLLNRRIARSGASNARGEVRLGEEEVDIELGGVVGVGMLRGNGPARSAVGAEDEASRERGGGVDDRRRAAARSWSI